MTPAPGVRRGLVGWSGFVGGELARRARPHARFRRADVDGLRDVDLDELVCAGAPAEKWRANADPEDDWAGLSKLISALDRSNAPSCVLVSTVDVFASSVGVTEDVPADVEQEQAYGRHRALLERFVESRFERTLVVRLPGMFGPGLKKNLLFDLLHQPGARLVNSASKFQFYDVRDLWGHMLVAQDAGLGRAHLATAPVGAAEIAQECFGMTYECDDRPVVSYDLHTAYADFLAGRDGPYLRGRHEILSSVRNWVEDERKAVDPA